MRFYSVIALLMTFSLSTFAQSVPEKKLVSQIEPFDLIVSVKSTGQKKSCRLGHFTKKTSRSSDVEGVITVCNVHTSSLNILARVEGNTLIVIDLNSNTVKNIDFLGLRIIDLTDDISVMLSSSDKYEL